MSAWNTDSGVAVHAEPLGEVWIEMGHKLTVFSFVKDDFHGEGFTSEDEDFVLRCFGTDEGTRYLDARPFLTSTYDIFIVEDLGMLPKDPLSKVFNLIKSIERKVQIDAAMAPYLFSIGERAEAIIEAFKQRQISAQEALKQLKELFGK